MRAGAARILGVNSISSIKMAQEIVQKWPQKDTCSMVYNGQGENGLVLAINFFPKKTISGHKFVVSRFIYK